LNGWAEIRRACVLQEDECVLALSKPTGISVVGERHGTDLVTLAHDAGERLLPVHRIDKVTSGAVLLAKAPWAHADLARQFSRRSAAKVYLAVTRSRGLPERGTIELPLSVGRKNRVRVAARRGGIALDEASGRWSVAPSEVFTHTRTYPSLTTFVRVWEDRHHTLLAVQPVTGRRHQIRVHLAWIGHPVEGDPLFGASAAVRTALHSWRIGFDAPWSGNARIEVEAPPGDDFWACLGTHLHPAPATLLDQARAAQRAASRR
jgi:tRNA pseudouridine32 synthase / 23S rRNA pseudouridine746 synthase